MGSKGNYPNMVQHFRLENYHNLPRSMSVGRCMPQVLVTDKILRIIPEIESGCAVKRVAYVLHNPSGAFGIM